MRAAFPEPKALLPKNLKELVLRYGSFANASKAIGVPEAFIRQNIIALSWQDIDWSNGVLEVNKTIQWMRTNTRPSAISMVPKNGRNRTVVLLPEVLQELRELQMHQARITGFIFSEEGIKIPSYSCVQHQYERAMKHASVNHKSTHIMRHSSATHFMETTKDPIALKGILGHSTMKMTDKYAKVTDRTIFDGMTKFKNAIEKLA